MAHNNLQHNPESINSDGKSGRRKYWPGNECEVMDSGWGIGTTRDRWSSSDRVIETPRSGIKWGRATNRVRISNIGPTYLFIGLLLLLQSSYLCHASAAVSHMTGSSASGGVNSGASVSYKEPLFLTESGAFKFVVGETISLPCDVTNPAAYVLAWKRGIAILTADKVKVTPDSRVHLSSGYTLQIKDAREQDAGDYICQIATIDPREITHHVEILVPPKIKHMTSGGGHLQVKKGSPVRLECSASGNPQPNITWTRKNNVLPNGEDKYVSPTYVIEKMDRHKGGTYICTANNGVGHIAISQINLHVLFPPEILIENSLVYSGEREEATLSCIIHGEMPPDVSWYKDTMQILPTDRISMDIRGAKHSLIIRHIMPTDFGNYSCVASNLLGKERKIVTLTGRPSPVVFQSPSLSQWRDKYNISWTVKSVSPIEEYRLYYKPVAQHYDMQRMRQTYSQHQDDNHLNDRYGNQQYQFNAPSWNGLLHNEWTNVTLSAYPITKKSIQGMSYVLRNLEPDTQYEARIEAKNRYGISDLSQPLLFSTSLTDSEVRDLGVTYYSNAESSREGHRFIMLLGVVWTVVRLQTH